MELLLTLLSLAATVVGQSNSTIVCIPGQCVQGYTNTTLGGDLSAAGQASSLHLLPGEYTSTTNPKLLNELLTSSSASLVTSPGFGSSKVSPLPINLKLEPGVSVYFDTKYSGQAAFAGLPTAPSLNTSTPVTANSIAIAENVWISVSAPNSQRVIIWESVPDVSQLSLTSSLTLLDMQSSTCSPACSSGGVCNASGQCVCAPNFSGTSCESCSAGFFGPECTACPEGCDDCDDGISGSGQCLSATVGEKDPKNCNCINGECNSDGTCSCIEGWTDGSTDKCSKCATGFFLSSTGDCTRCQVGCSQCNDGTAECTTCRSGFTQNPNDRTICTPTPQADGNGLTCPTDNFSDGQACQRCASACETCSGPGALGCLTCARDSFFVNGQCVTADSNGICSGTNGMVADTLKRVCDVCPSKCTSCAIPGFNGSQRINSLQCTACVPGSVLSEGKCVDSCPAGTFVNPLDNLTCIPCSSSCATCAGSADFCLSCTGSQFASGGQCVPTCPASTFASSTDAATNSRTCTQCHPDCETCSGPSFTQCLTCSESRPVLQAPTGSTSGRCLATCSKTQYFDAASKTCRSCDGACGSCTGPGASSCLSCSSPSQVVKNGQCADAACASGTSVVPGLGMCLSDFVTLPSKTDSGDAPPLPSISGISEPAPAPGMRLLWWQILLMALGCAFIFVMVLWCCRRRARKQRAKRTELFAHGKGIDKNGNRKWDWGRPWRFMFQRKPKHTVGANNSGSQDLPISYNHQDMMGMANLGRSRDDSYRDVDFDRKDHHNNINITLAVPPSKSNKSSRSNNNNNNNSGHRKSRDDDFESYIDAYDYSRRSMSIHSNTPSTLPDLDGFYSSRQKAQQQQRDRLRRQATTASARTRERRDIDEDSLYSQVTGLPRNAPAPRMPVKSDARPIIASSSLSRSPSPTLRSHHQSPNKLKKSFLETPGRKAPASSTANKPSPFDIGDDSDDDDDRDEVVISPRQKDGVLVDLESLRHPSPSASPATSALSSPQHLRQLHLPLQYQHTTSSLPILPPIQAQPTFQSLNAAATMNLTDAQAYAMAVKPALHGTAPVVSNVQPTAAQAGYTLAWVPTHMTGASANSMPSQQQPQQQQQYEIPLPTFTALAGSPTALPPATSSTSYNGLYWPTGVVQPTHTGASGASRDTSKNPFRPQPQAF